MTKSARVKHVMGDPIYVPAVRMRHLAALSSRFTSQRSHRDVSLITVCTESFLLRLLDLHLSDVCYLCHSGNWSSYVTE